MGEDTGQPPAPARLVRRSPRRHAAGRASFAARPTLVAPTASRTRSRADASLEERRWAARSPRRAAGRRSRDYAVARRLQRNAPPPRCRSSVISSAGT
jgi:hypothetical protein